MSIPGSKGNRLHGVSAMRTEDSEFGRFTVLVCALSIFMVALPFISETGFGMVIFRTGTILLLSSAVYSVSERRWQLILAIVLALPAVAVQIAPTLLGEPGSLMLRFGMSALFFVYIAVLISNYLLKQSRVSADMILGAINVYLLLAIGFMFLHAFVEVVKPGAYLYQGESLSIVLKGDPEIDALAFLLYFSVVTLTTLGYGDITPAVPAARMLCSFEAVIGQLFVAVFIARLVSLHISSRSR
jgi:voltage-gated potassium channel Kch